MGALGLISAAGLSGTIADGTIKFGVRSDANLRLPGFTRVRPAGIADFTPDSVRFRLHF